MRAETTRRDNSRTNEAEATKRTEARRRVTSPTRFIRATFRVADTGYADWKKTTNRREVTPRPSQAMNVVNQLELKINVNIDDTNKNRDKLNEDTQTSC